MKKIMSILIMLSFMLPLITACDKPSPPDDTTEVPVETFNLTKEILSQYKIVTPEMPSEDFNDTIITLRQQINDKTGIDLPWKDDYVKEGSDTYKIDEYEILVGNTNRPETAVYYSKLKIKDHGYALINKKVVIFGHSDEYVEKAVSLFYLNVLKDDTDSSEYIIKSGTEDFRHGEYKMDNFTINDIEINNYSVVYPRNNMNGEKIIALSLCDYITSISGYVLKCYPDTSTYDNGYEIQIGDTNRITEEMKNQRTDSGYSENNTYISNNENLLWISGDSKLSLGSARTQFTNLISVSNKEAKIEIDEGLKTAVISENIKVMNYNIRYAFETDLRNPDDVIVSIKQQNPDIFGVLEDTPAWLDKLNNAFGSEYTCVEGKPIDTSDDPVRNSIYYRTSDFELIEKGTKWMSATPDRMSKFSESNHYKGFTYAILRSLHSGIEFMYVNVHTDYNADTAKKNISHALQIPVLRDFLKGYSNLPIIIGGDFNTTPNHDTIRILTKDTRVVNSTTIAKEKIDNPTLVTNYTSLNIYVFDYFFVTDDTISVSKYEAVDNKMNGKYPSDHLPVVAEISIYSTIQK